MKAFKKIASIVIASSMLASFATAFAARPAAEDIQAAISKEFGDAYNTTTKTIALELDADTDIKESGASGDYGDEYIIQQVKAGSATTYTADFKSTLAMNAVREAFGKYQKAADEVCKDNEEFKALLEYIPVKGTFDIYVVYNGKMTPEDEIYHTTVGSMNGFNEKAKQIFKDTARTIIPGKAITADGEIADVTEYDTLKITVEAKSPTDGTLVYGDLAKNVEEVLADISYTVDNVSVNEASVSDPIYCTVSISMAGGIVIGNNISTINFTTKQLANNEDTYPGVKDWEEISATMIIAKKSGGGNIVPGGSGHGGLGTPVPTATPAPATTEPIATATPDPDATMDPNTPSSTIPPYDPSNNTVPSTLNGDDHFVYIIGYPEGDVRPEGNITREEVATIFYRILADEYRDTIYTKHHNYSDVELSRWSNKAIATLTNGGFIQGYGDDNNTFKPAGDMTRLEFIVMATNFLDESDAGFDYLDDVKFTDVPGKLAWGQEALQKAAIAELIDEDERTSFRPEEKIKRHEAMKIINRLLVRNVKADGLIDGFVQWPDNPVDAKYYFEVIEATNSHTFTRLADGYEKWTSVDQNWIWGEFKTKYEDPDAEDMPVEDIE